MPKFRNVGPDDVSVYKPEGEAGAQHVATGDVIEVPGQLLTSRPAPKKDEPAPEPLPTDAYVIAFQGEERAWSHAMWELVEKPAAKTDPVKEN